jgi:hypothetical protein
MEDLFEGAFDYSTIATVEECKRAAVKLDEIREGNPKQRKYAKRQNLVGFLTERLFAMTALCPYRPALYVIPGDDGIDFTCHFRNGWGIGRRVAIDIKGTEDRTRSVLWVPTNTVKKVDIYILARLRDIEQGTGELFRWVWQHEVLDKAPRETAPWGNECYAMREGMHEMSELWDRADKFLQHIRAGEQVPY